MNVVLSPGLDDGRPLATEGPGLCRLPDWGLLKISGDDAAGFLQGQATCDIQALAVGGIGCGAFCTHKGRVIANFRIARTPAAFYLLLAAALVEPVRKRLAMYVLRSKVTLEPLTGDRIQLLGAWGPEIEQRLAAAGLPNDTDTAHAWQDFPCGGALKLDDGSGRYVLAVENSETRRLEDLTRDLTPLHPDVWRLRDIQAGFPLVLPATQEEFLPQMLNLDALNGIGFSKGCYTGQEIVTRTHYLGQLKRRMYRFDGDTASVPVPGAPIYDTRGAEPVTAGQIVNACRQTSDIIQCLAVLSLEHAKSNALSVTARNGPVLDRRTLPYPLPDSQS